MKYKLYNDDELSGKKAPPIVVMFELRPPDDHAQNLKFVALYANTTPVPLFPAPVLTVNCPTGISAISPTGAVPVVVVSI